MNTVKHENPYRDGSNYHMGFAYIQNKQIVTRSELIQFLMDKGVVSTKKNRIGNEAAISTATVLLSPREKDGRGDCRGNLSSKGELYFMQPLKKIKGEEKKFRLRWRIKALDCRDYIRPSILATQKEVKQEKTITTKDSASVKTKETV